MWQKKTTIPMVYACARTRVRAKPWQNPWLYRNVNHLSFLLLSPSLGVVQGLPFSSLLFLSLLPSLFSLLPSPYKTKQLIPRNLPYFPRNLRHFSRNLPLIFRHLRHFRWNALYLQIVLSNNGSVYLDTKIPFCNFIFWNSEGDSMNVSNVQSRIEHYSP